jgi:hypothetical protein
MCRSSLHNSIIIPGKLAIASVSGCEPVAEARPGIQEIKSFRMRAFAGMTAAKPSSSSPTSGLGNEVSSVLKKLHTPYAVSRQCFRVRVAT